MGPTHNRVVYAALGDSMSIDDYAGGPGRGAASLRSLMGPEAPILVALNQENSTSVSTFGCCSVTARSLASLESSVAGKRRTEAVPARKERQR